MPKSPNAPDPGKALEALLGQVNAQHGAGTAMQLGATPLPAVEVVTTGSVLLDEALGVGGLPLGRIIELYGPESSGKTSIALRAAANFQQAMAGTDARSQRWVGFIDAEHALDPSWAATLGVTVDDLVVSQPDTGEQALEVTEQLARSRLFGLLIIDSVAALVPKAEIEGSMGDSHVGLQARLMSQAMRKLTGVLNETKTTALFINQLREKVGVFYGNPETTAGGKALKFYASIRMDVRRVETLKEPGSTEAIGNRVRVKVVKNKVSPPFREAHMDLMFGTGFSREGELLDVGVLRGVVKKSGTWYTLPEGSAGATATIMLGQGKEKARAYLSEHPALADAIDLAVRAAGIDPGAKVLPKGKPALAAADGPPPWETTSV